MLWSKKLKKRLVKHWIGQRRGSRRAIKPVKPNVLLNEEKNTLLRELNESRSNFFITGKAGTGKSTLLQYFRATSEKNIAVVAFTGVAALNIQGQTIHSFFRFPIDITPDKLRRPSAKRAEIYKHLDTLVIDEISMVRADLFDCVEKFLRENGPQKGVPFGGVQIVLFGDLLQLPPVVPSHDRKLFESYYKSPYFFDVPSFQTTQFTYRELHDVFRQSDREFIELLNSVRCGEISESELDLINGCINNTSDKEHSLTLVPTNSLAEHMNNKELNELPGKEKIYIGHIVNEFRDKNLPTPERLSLKEGARIMLLVNDPGGRYVNGDLATVVTMNDSSISVMFDDGSYEDVILHTWEEIHFEYNSETKKIESEVIGSYTQLPVKLAWAVTIHKSQGKTYDHITIDWGNGAFAHGQAYVALSRCKTLGGISLLNSMQYSDIILDERVKDFMLKMPKHHF